MVQVHCNEGVANRIGPEPCAVIREGGGEASAGERAGQPLSRERNISRVPTLYQRRKATRPDARARVFGRPGVVIDPGMRARSSHGNREISSLAIERYQMVRIGKAKSRSR